VNKVDWLSPNIRSAAVKRSLKAGDILFRAGGKVLGLCEVVSGVVRLVRVDRAGREVVLHKATAGATLAEASLYSSTYHCDAIASSDAVVRLYPKAAVLKSLDQNPKAARAFTAMLARQVMTLRTRLEQRNIHSAHDRVRHYLAVHAGSDGRTVELAGTIKDLASELGLTHEALYRTLADMQTKGEIERLPGTIKLLTDV
jgi:CRP-like cAMP-binding protein